MTEDWELDFNNPPRIPPSQEDEMDNPMRSFFHLPKKGKRAPHILECCVCQQTMMEGFEIPVVKTVGGSTVQDFVCSKACQEVWHIRQIRLGL